MHKKRPQAVRVKPSGDPDRPVEIALDGHHASDADAGWACFHLTRTQARTVMLALTAELGKAVPEWPVEHDGPSETAPRRPSHRNPRPSPREMTMRVYRVNAESGEEVPLVERRLVRASELPLLTTMAYPPCYCRRCESAPGNTAQPHGH
jgi:hypothetical protein